MVKILDASALLAYLEKEPGYEKVKDFFVKAIESDRNLLMTTVNWGEVCYILQRDYLDRSEEILKLIKTFPVDLVPVDEELARQAAYFKAEKKLPFLDCFAAALAKLRKGELLTTDKDFKVIEAEIKVVWI